MVPNPAAAAPPRPGGLQTARGRRRVGTEQLIAAGILLGAVVGALVCSVLSERWGRHCTILLVCCGFVAGSLLSSISPTAVTLTLSAERAPACSPPRCGAPTS